MAIFRAETKSLSRGKGHNLVAAISYRAGIKLTDNNKINPNARSYDYTKKTDVVHRDIVLPKNLSAQLAASDIELDFQSIADLVEIGETTLRGKMKNSARLAREWVLCGVPELTRAENIELFQQFAQQQSEEQGVLSMVFVHDPTAGDDMATVKAANGKSVKSSDPRNIHAHILLLTRKLEISADNSLSLGDKSDSELSNDERTRPIVANELVGSIDPQSGDKIQQGRGLCSNSDWLKNTRKQWADILNERLVQKGVQPVTHQSYKDLGSKFKPTKHLGKDASILERMGILTDFGKYNESINQYNRTHIEFATERFTVATEQNIERSQQWIESINTGCDELQQRIDGNKRDIRGTDNRIGELNTRARDSKQCIDNGKQGFAWANTANAGLNHIYKSNARNFTEQERSVDSAIATTVDEINWTDDVIGGAVGRIERHERQSITAHRIIASRHRPAPNPYTDRARARKLRADELSKRTKSFDHEAEQYRDRTAAAAAELNRRCHMEFNGRNRNVEKYDERQTALLNDFADMNGLNSGDVRQKLRSSHVFFENMPISGNEKIIRVLCDPTSERIEYEKNGNGLGSYSQLPKKEPVPTIVDTPTVAQPYRPRRP